MTTHQLISAKPAGTASPSVTVIPVGLLQRQCACGGTSGPSGECEECAKKKRTLQRKANDSSAPRARLSPSRLPALQPKLIIGASNDPLEREADRIAEQVLAAAAQPAVSGAPPCIQRFTGQPAGQADTAPLSVDRVLADPGTPLDPALQQDMGQRFGHDFSRVRVHSGTIAEQSARDVNAKAYTVGHNIVFGAGRFAPGTPQGQRLIAHELTHVVQQGGADRGASGDSPGLVQRDTTTPGEATPPGTPDPGESIPTLQAKPPDTTLVNDRVDLVKVSCAQNRLAFLTKGATYLYTLTACDRTFPPGRYTARVKNEREKRLLGFFLKPTGSPTGPSDVAQEPAASEDLPLVKPPPAKPGAPVATDVDEEVRFRFSWAIAQGQIDPVDLMQDEDIVPVEIGADIVVPTEKRKECLITLAPRTIIKPNSGHVDLTKYVPKAMQDVKYEWNLVDVGLADIKLRVGGHVGAFADWEHSAGQVLDICLSSSDRGGYSGRARFTIDGNVHFQVDVTAFMEVVAQLLELIDIASIGGSLTLTGTADLNGKLNALVEVDFDPKHPLDLRLATDIEMAALTLLQLNLSAEAGFEILGFDIWKGEWPSVWSGGAGYAWTGGLTFDNSFIPSVELGSIEKASPMQIQSKSRPSRSSPGRAVRRESRREVPTRQLIEQAIKDEDGKVLYDGSTRAKALPLQWFKPKSLYPQEIPFDPQVNPGVRPLSVNLADGPTRVFHDTVVPSFGDPIEGPSRIGVTEENFPEAVTWSRGFQFREPTGEATRENSDEMRELLKGLGWHPSAHGTDIDHVRELQFGGADQAHNLWPFGNSENRSAGPLHKQQIDAFRRTVSRDLQDRWMRINKIGLTKDYKPRY